MFNGELYKTLGDTELKIGKKAGGEAYHGSILGIRVLVKKKKITRDILWKDEMKPSFGLQKVGVSYFVKEGTFILRFFPNRGTLKVSDNLVDASAFGDWFLRLCLYDFVIQNGDRHSNNILVLTPTELLGIDESVTRRPTDRWCPRFKNTIVAKILQSIAELIPEDGGDRRVALREHMKSLISPTIEEELNSLAERYQFTEGERERIFANLNIVQSDVEWMDYMWRSFGCDWFGTPMEDEE